jgi:hypothetical protein
MRTEFYWSDRVVSDIHLLAQFLCVIESVWDRICLDRFYRMLTGSYPERATNFAKPPARSFIVGLSRSPSTRGAKSFEDFDEFLQKALIMVARVGEEGRGKYFVT